MDAAKWSGDLGRALINKSPPVVFISNSRVTFAVVRLSFSVSEHRRRPAKPSATQTESNQSRRRTSTGTGWPTTGLPSWPVCWVCPSQRPATLAAASFWTMAKLTLFSDWWKRLNDGMLTCSFAYWPPDLPRPFVIQYWTELSTRRIFSLGAPVVLAMAWIIYSISDTGVS